MTTKTSEVRRHRRHVTHTPSNRRRRSPTYSVAMFMSLVTTFLLSAVISFCSASDRLGEGGTYSFSLTTFDPSGKLGQVERAMTAASLGVPLLAACHNDGIISFVAPQMLPSPLHKDDGTTRFSPISPNIAICHSGISADGRVVIAAAQQLAMEHAFTFDEPIPISIFLEEVSLLFQEYTMKVGARPMGVTLLIGYVPHTEDDADSDASPQLYRIDPSGAVSSLGKTAIVNGNFGTTDIGLQKKLEQLAEENLEDEESRRRLWQIMSEALDQASKDKGVKVLAPTTILTASLSRNNGFTVDRISPSKQ